MLRNGFFSFSFFQACAILDYVYFSHCLICCLIIGISYIVYGRYDISFWCLCIGIVSGLSLAAVSSGQKGSSSRIGSGKVGQFLDESGSGGGLRIEDEMIREEGDGMSGWLTCQ